jgi:hypothetical protein
MIISSFILGKKDRNNSLYSIVVQDTLMNRELRLRTQITHSLPHHPPINEQIRPVWLSQCLAENETNWRIDSLRDIELEGGNEEAHSRSVIR